MLKPKCKDLVSWEQCHHWSPWCALICLQRSSGSSAGSFVVKAMQTLFARPNPRIFRVLGRSSLCGLDSNLWPTRETNVSTQRRKGGERWTFFKIKKENTEAFFVCHHIKYNDCVFIINKFLSIQMRILYSALLEVVGWHIKLKTQYYVKVKDRKRIEYRHIKGLKQPHHRVDTCNWKHNMVIWILNWIKSDDET